MLTKLLALLHSKVAVAAVGAALIGTTGVALAATQGNITLPGAATSIHDKSGQDTPHSTAGAIHAHTVNIEGTLVSCTGAPITPAATKAHEGDSSDGTPEATPAAAATHEADSADSTPEATSAAHAAPVSGVMICVTDKDGKTWHVLVTSETKINGDHASAGGDLSKAIGHRVEVQAEATPQPDGSYVAWKVTMEGADDGAEATPGGKSDDHGGASGTSTPESTGSDSGQSQQVEESGIISALGTNSFTLTLVNGAQQTITISNATAFEGMVHQFSDLKAQMHVSVQGMMQADHSVAATRIQAEE